MGNLRSVQKALEHLGAECRVQTHLDGADKLIIPGVGAFGAAMERLAPMREAIRDFAASGRPVLGICLGQQLLFETSEELGEHQGLGLLPGRVVYFQPQPGLKIPHMGWNALSASRATPLTAGLEPGDQVYFVHSLHTVCTDASDVAATSEHGATFHAAVVRGNVWGTQFHPEKSGAVGLRMLGNFVRC